MLGGVVPLGVILLETPGGQEPLLSTQRVMGRSLPRRKPCHLWHVFSCTAIRTYTTTPLSTIPSGWNYGLRYIQKSIITCSDSALMPVTFDLHTDHNYTLVISNSMYILHLCWIWRGHLGKNVEYSFCCSTILGAVTAVQTCRESVYI